MPCPAFQVSSDMSELMACSMDMIVRDGREMALSASCD
jgi:hypothetical protein